MTSLHHPQATALPTRVRLARHRSVLPLGAGARVVGLDPDTAFVVDGLPPPLAALLDRLGRPARTAELVAAAAARGVPAAVTRELLAQLVDAGALVDAAPAERAARARYAEADRGGERLAATQAAVRRLLPSAGTRGPPLRSCPDLVVLADETPEPALVDELRARGLAHLAVRLRDGVGVVGPVA